MTNTSGSTTRSEKFSKQVKATIEQLRLSLLDLTARNPLISMQFANRSNSHVRVVDELPDLIFYKLSNRQSMEFKALPSFEEDSKDEVTPKFGEAYSSALLTDEEYAKLVAKLDGDDEAYDDKLRRIQRELKDRVREHLGMPKRITRKQESLIQHARNNGIEPSYDLPQATENAEDGRHQDDLIQTLLVRADLERRLNGMISKAKTFEQETGISVMRLALGFLDWQDPARPIGKRYLSPLVLLPVEITARKSVEGVLYRVEGTGDDPELNLALAEKLRQEFGIELPLFESGSIEEYFERINSIKNSKLSWTVRRQVVLGVFPSSRMAMYEDLDTSKTDFSTNNIVESVIVGSGAAGSGAIAEEYHVDHPQIEAEVPILVKKADQSQFSVLVDLARGKTFAVQGPPGTGKSETIVNAIAAAIFAGKKVLFVAEKAAALKVVNARLVDVGLGEFALPLLAGRTSRDEFMKSLRARMPLRDGKPRDLETNIERFKRAREALAEYIEILSREWVGTKKTIHAVLGSAIASAPMLETLPTAFLLDTGLPTTELTDDEIDDTATVVEKFAAAHRSMDDKPSFWRGLNCLDATPRKIDYILHRTDEAAQAAERKGQAKAALAQFGIDSEISDSDLAKIHDALVAFMRQTSHASAKGNSKILDPENTPKIQTFFSQCAAATALWKELRVIFDDPTDIDLSQDIQTIRDVCQTSKLTRLDLGELFEKLTEKKGKANSANMLTAQIERFVSYWPSAGAWSLKDIAVAGNLARDFRDVLHLRSASLAEPGTQFTLRSLLQKLEEIESRKADLLDRFHGSALRAQAELEDALITLRNPGRLRLFSSAFKNARSLYLEHSKKKVFDLAVATTEFQDAVEFLREFQDFIQLSKDSGVFGVGFLGMETNFELYQRLACFYEALESAFVRVDQREIRSFLKSAEIDHLTGLPELPSDQLPGRASDIAPLAARLDAEAEGFDAAHAKLAPLMVHFTDPSGVPVNELQHFAEKVSEFQALSAQLDRSEVGGQLLGSEFRGWRTAAEDWTPILEASKILAVAGIYGNHIRQAVEHEQIASLAAALSAAIAAVDGYSEKISLASEEASHDFTGPLSGFDQGGVISALYSAAKDRSGLTRSISLANLRSELNDKGVISTVESIIEHTEATQDLGKTTSALFHRGAAERIYKYYGGELRHYSGSRIEDLRSQMKNADEKVIELSRKQIRAELIASAKPPQGVARGRVSEMTEGALLEYLSDMRRISVPVRDIIRRSFHAIRELKPIWMMSPLAIAQYVPKDGHGFDLCIIDEASQMPPADAIGALYRCRQALVVGDSKQLPPTNFFRQFSDDNQTIDDDADLVTEESILEKTASAFKPSRTLRWHYRSRHSGLIRFSNKIIYKDDLVVFPSSDEDRPDMGVQLVATGGLYKSNMNEIEAKAVVEAALSFMKDEPDRSLGIVAVNQKQADYIREILDQEIPRNSHASLYVEKWSKASEGLEEFFVKNLENVQGDQRDVIFISTVYGPSAPGQKAMQRFGPINGEGGKRRLNVLFTRAKLNLRTFTSLSSADITATEHSNAGAWMLKRWLEYSAGMQFDVANDEHGGPFDSPFEEHVAEMIEGMGYSAVRQVGSAGFWIDIGVRHPDWPNGFILGVECDGAAYHSSKSARDRDHYRQSILEGLGWTIHRIWSTDWYQDPAHEKLRLKNAIDERLADLKARGQRKPASALSNSPATKNEMHPESRAPEAIGVVLTANRVGHAQDSLPLWAGAVAGTALEAAVSKVATDKLRKNDNSFVEIGDTVRVRYLDNEAGIFQFRIVSAPSAPEKGIVNKSAPLAVAVLGSKEADTVEILHGSRIRMATLEMLKKSS